MTSIQSIIVGPRFGDPSNEATSPATVRLPVATNHAHLYPHSHHSPTYRDEAPRFSPATTIKHSYGAVPGQNPLPTATSLFSPISPSGGVDTSPLMARPPKRESVQSLHSSSGIEIDMDAVDEFDDGHVSDGEAVDPDTGKPGRKRKGPRFYCVDYPPCKLSFTRSEHLARHIRKHTGERPFQCHCSRRFSRLDNLRQHAQTVHVNEDIPLDSPAATGARFQRQIRTERMTRHPPPSRSRASTIGSQPSQPRGHGRTLSTSSISSVAARLSIDDTQRRLPSTPQGHDINRPPFSMDAARMQPNTPPGQASFFRESSGGISTPTSTTYSTGAHSPGGYGSAIGSPTTTPRSSLQWDSDRLNPRRLSGPPIVSSVPYSHTQPLSPQHLASPISSKSSGRGLETVLQQSPHEIVDSEGRRRTWHPTPHVLPTLPARSVLPRNFSRPVTSGGILASLRRSPEQMNASNYSYDRPSTATAANVPRLPGIETFDMRPADPARASSPMHVDSAIASYTPSSRSSLETSIEGRRARASWDMSLHQNLNKLDIRAGGSSPRTSLSFTPAYDSRRLSSDAGDQPTSAGNRSAKRQGWYAGSPTAASASGRASITSLHNQPIRETEQHDEGSWSMANNASSPIKEAQLHASPPELPPSLAPHSPDAYESINQSSQHVSSCSAASISTDPTRPQLPSLPSIDSRQGGITPFQPREVAMSGLDALVAAAARGNGPGLG